MKLLSTIFVSLLLGGCTSFNGTIVPASSYTLKKNFVASKYVAPNGVQLMVRTYFPEIDGYGKCPLVVYLHGAGQNGNDNEKQLDDGVGCIYAFMRGRDDYQAVVVVPQCPAGVFWREEEMLSALKTLIETYADNPHIDSNRIYVTGFSMGGDATWKLGIAYPELMTTLMPVCGGPMASMPPEEPDVPEEMSSLCIWAFNNFDDGVVRPSYSKKIFAQLWDMSDSDRLNFTENVTGGHNGKAVFSNRNILIWMFSTTKGIEENQAARGCGN